MSERRVALSKRVAWALVLSSLTFEMALAASNNCTALGQLPAVVEVAQGAQQALNSPVSISRIAVGDPSVADVHANGSNDFLLTGVAPGTTSLMVWTACSKSPRQSMVFVKGRATEGFTSSALPPSADATLPSQVQTDIRFVEVSRTKLQEASTSIFGMGKDFLFGSPGSFISNAESVITGGPVANGKYFNIGFGGGRVKAMINALEGSGFAYTLARPSLVALSGQSATFLAGGEVP
ncbi:MAG: pilus assembly protein N-terminal domain-containing protein, partial [Pseudomonas sp.]|nr:pilus assembly protein N-terminal domain-containing protein [Pseudomonas sp.]